MGSMRDCERGVVTERKKVVTKEGTMYTNILIPTDGSELAGKAVQHGIALAKRIGAKVTVLTVLPPFHVFTTDPQMIEDTPALYKARMQEHAEKILGTVARAAQAAGVTCEMVHVEHEHPYRAIIDTAASKDCDLIVMASHGRHGISAIILGSETVKVLTHSKIPVLVHR
jgi:nucleotide-binding universal stress UspA family protein